MAAAVESYLQFRLALSLLFISMSFPSDLEKRRAPSVQDFFFSVLVAPQRRALQLQLGN